MYSPKLTLSRLAMLLNLRRQIEFWPFGYAQFSRSFNSEWSITFCVPGVVADNSHGGAGVWLCAAAAEQRLNDAKAE